MVLVGAAFPVTLRKEYAAAAALSLLHYDCEEAKCE